MTLEQVRNTFKAAASMNCTCEGEPTVATPELAVAAAGGCICAFVIITIVVILRKPSKQLEEDTHDGFFVLRQTGKPPTLPGTESCPYHLFMSHTWKTVRRRASFHPTDVKT